MNYKLVNVDSIRVHKSRFNRAHFEHKLHILNSVDTEFKVHEEVMHEYSDSNAVLLMKNVRKPREFLNLSPFIIDTNGESIDTKEKQLLKKDVYVFDNYDGLHLNYVGVEAESIGDLAVLSDYSLLQEEFEQLIQILNQ